MAGLLLVSSGAFAQQTWKELIANGNFEGSDLSNFSISIKDEGSRNLNADDIITEGSNHYAKLAFTVSPTKTNFIIQLSEPLKAGDVVKFSMRAKSNATKDLSIITEVLGRLLVKKDDWSTLTYEGVVKAEQDQCQTITFKFDRNSKQADIFYFDDMSLKVCDGNTPIEFVDNKVKEICVSKWDTNGDGKLSMGEAAAVTDIGNAFTSNTEIISFDEFQYFTGITSLKEDAFYGCSFMESIILPNNITEIGADRTYSWMGAFKWCYRMTSITLGNKIEVIGNDTFARCDVLTSINMPESIEKIGDYAFSYCTYLTSINIPKNVKTIGYGAFSDCMLIPTLVIPKSVESIEYDSFIGCSGLTSIVVEEGNKYFDSRENCNALIKTKTNELMVGSSNSFIPSTVTSIVRGAFTGRKGLSSLTIPKSVILIAYGAFNSCSDLTSIIVEEGNPKYDSRNNCNALIETATNTLLTGCQNTIIPNSVATIASSAFINCSGLTTISIPSSVIKIEESAFYGCSGLTAINVEEGNPNYDSRYNCNALIETATDSLITGCRNTSIPLDIKRIAPNAFYRCTGLSFVRIPNGVNVIRGYTFYGCLDLTTVVIGNGMENTENYAFGYCPKLKDVYCYAEQVPAVTPYPESPVFDNAITNATLHVPAASIEAYRNAESWKDFKEIVALTDSDPNPTGITNVSNNMVTGERYYSLDGKRLDQPQRGLNIIRKSDGTTKKVVIK